MSETIVLYTTRQTSYQGICQGNNNTVHKKSRKTHRCDVVILTSLPLEWQSSLKTGKEKETYNFVVNE